MIQGQNGDPGTFHLARTGCGAPGQLSVALVLVGLL